MADYKRAHAAVKAALRRGELREAPCETCGGWPVQAHHDHYDRPLDVRWLCSPCHHSVHFGSSPASPDNPTTHKEHRSPPLPPRTDADILREAEAILEGKYIRRLP